METCKVCGGGLIGKEKICPTCKRKARQARQARARQARQARESVMRDMGLVKVRGALGGVYWE
jgi:uncharacterized Zn finger protein (UPF0148 family)